MTEELKYLIEKINTEGVKAAEDKAREIENQANRRAQAIVDKAGREAAEITREAEERIAKMEEGAKVSIKQVSRDLILSLRKEIEAMLGRLIVSQVHKALGPDEMAKTIAKLIKDHGSVEKGGIIVSLNKDELKKIEEWFLRELAGEARKGITLKASEDIHGGFAISYDSGKSHYDFTDKALAEYMASYLKPRLAQILKEITAGIKGT